MKRLAYLFLMLASMLAACNVEQITQHPTVEMQVTFSVAAVPSSTPQPSATPTPEPEAAPVQGTVHTVCAADCDFITIQQAIDAGETADGDVISLLDPVHTEQGIQVNKSVVIQGQEMESSVIQAHELVEDATQRIFHIWYGAQVTIRDITIQHGHPTECPMYGGAILNDGTLTLVNCQISDNIASAGGGIMNSSELTLINCILKDNVAAGYGGEDGSGKGSGGGIKNMLGNLTIVDSTISGNRAARNGGALKISCAGVLTMTNSIVSGNFAAEDGGGLEIRGVAFLENSTIANNLAAELGDGLFIQGNTLHTRGILNLNNTVMVDNGENDCHRGENATIQMDAATRIDTGSCAGATD